MNIKRILLTALLPIGLSFTTNAQSISPSTKWHWDKGQIIIDTPSRPAGQENVLGLVTPKLPTVRVAFVGLGMRGPGAVNCFVKIPGVQIMAFCDYEEERAEACQGVLRNAGLAPADIYFGDKGYEELCQRPDIDLVYVATDWEHHFPVAKCALENGKHTAVEVPSCLNLEQCWELINLSEKNRKHCMILENCCYDFFEMNALRMAQEGVFGEVLRAEGAYIHNLTPFWDAYWKNPNGTDPDGLGWRLKYNKENRGDVYATHGLGPVAQALNIHRGDRFTTLVAMDTKSVVGKELVEKRTGKTCDEFVNGDHTTTLMRTELGKVVEMQHNVMTYQPYSRLYKLTGTKGYCTKYPDEHFALDGESLTATGIPVVDELNTHGFMSEEQQEKLVEKYYDPILKKYGDLGRELGHGGMDFIMMCRLVYCLQNGLPLDMDVYDLAEWCCLAELGAISMNNNSASVAFPDFTRGAWNLQNGYRHAFADPAEEAAAEEAAKASTEAQKALVVKKKLWEKYDKAKNKARAAKNKKSKK